MKLFLSTIENTNHKRNFIILLFCLIQISCHDKVDSQISVDNTNEVTYIEFYYVPLNRNYPMTFSCGRIRGGPLPVESERYYYKTSNVDFTRKFLFLYKKFKTAAVDDNFDAKIQGLVHFSGKTDTICMSGTDKIIVNGVYMEPSDGFSDFVVAEISKNYRERNRHNK